MIDYRYLRPEKAKYLMQRENSDFPEIEVNYQIYDNAVILPLRKNTKSGYLFGNGGVNDSDGNYIESSGIEFRFWGNYETENIAERNEEVVYCGLFMKRWGHFLVESVSRLWYFLEHDDGISKYVFVVEENGNKEIKDNYMRFFELLGISDRIEIINKPTRFKSIIIPEIGYSRTNYFTAQYKKIFGKIIENAVNINPTINKADKIYFSRGHFSKAVRSEIGNDLLETYFVSNGFTILHPEELTLEEMICYIQNADICATPSGTLPHNFLFAQDNKKVIIIERQAVINEIQVDVDRIKNLDTIYVDGHWLIYPALSGGGPFCYGYTKEFEKFTSDNNYLHPEEKYFSEKYKKQCLNNFMKVHRNYYGYDWGMEQWTTIYVEALVEAHKDTVNEFYDYIKGIKPFSLKHYFELPYIKHMVKQLLFKMIGKNKNEH